MNNFDKLLGKNGELDELRKEQVMAGAIGIIRRQYAGRSKMEAIAALFGKKLGESFTVRIGTNIASACAFKNNGLFCEGRPCEIMLWNLLTGEVEIVEG